MEIKDLKLLSCWHDGVFYTEEWKDLPGYEGVFKVSSFGRVWSCVRMFKRKNINGGYLIKQTGGFLLGQSNSSGYKRVRLCHNGREDKFSVHVLVCRTFHPNTHSQNFVNHKDFNRTNNFFLNLEWCTQRENNRHLFASKTKTGFPGVHNLSRGRFRGLIMINGVKHRTKVYHSLNEAIEEYEIIRNKLGVE